MPAPSLLGHHNSPCSHSSKCSPSGGSIYTPLRGEVKLQTISCTSGLPAHLYLDDNSPAVAQGRDQCRAGRTSLCPRMLPWKSCHTTSSPQEWPWESFFLWQPAHGAENTGGYVGTGVPWKSRGACSGDASSESSLLPFPITSSLPWPTTLG